MKLQFLASWLLIFIAISFAQITENDLLKVSTGAEPQHFIKNADGQWVSTPANNETWHILNQNNQRIFLRGVNAGGWFIHEPWMTPLDAGSAVDQYNMMRVLGERFGAAKRDELVAVYEDNYWTEADFDNCAAMGMSVIRLPFTWMNLVHYGDEGGTKTQNEWRTTLRPDAFKRIDWFIENCQKRGIYVIVDMHGAYGSQNGMDHSGWVNGGWDLYTGQWAQQNQDNTVWLWGEIAKRYNKNTGARKDLAPVIAFYDILNEPGPKAGNTTQLQWDVFDRIYDEIRKNDPDHIICVESCWSPNNLPRTTQYGWTNVVYQYHQYVWDHVNNLQGQIAAYDNIVNQVRNANHGTPTFIGEFTAFGIEAAWDYAINKYNEAGWHWTSWTYKVLSNMGSWGVYLHNPQKVNVNTDSEAAIRQKWSSVGANNAWANNMVRGAIMRGLPGNLRGKNPFTTANIALGKTITATSEEEHESQGILRAEYANDGEASTRWGSERSDNQSITIDLGDYYDLDGIGLLWEAAYAKGYKIEILQDYLQTGEEWKTVKTVTNGIGGNEYIVFEGEFEGIETRYIRLTATERATEYGISLYEFEVYGENSTATPITKPVKSDNGYGIKFVQNIVSEKANISVIIPEKANAEITIYDAVGNVVFSENINIAANPLGIVWNLTNTAGRKIADGSYLVVVEAKGINGQLYRYSAKLGVKR